MRLIIDHFKIKTLIIKNVHIILTIILNKQNLKFQNWHKSIIQLYKKLIQIIPIKNIMAQ